MISTKMVKKKNLTNKTTKRKAMTTKYKGRQIMTRKKKEGAEKADSGRARNRRQGTSRNRVSLKEQS